MRKVGWLERQVRRADGFQQRHAVIAFPWAVVQKFGNDQAGGKAALMAYYGLFALFPLLLLLATVLGFAVSGNPQLRDQLIDSALGYFPVIGDQLRSEVHPLEGNTTALVIGIAGTLYGSFGVGFAAQNAMNTVWNIPYVRWPGLGPRYLRTLGVIGLLGLAVLSSTALTAFATAVAHGADATVLALAASFLVNLGLFLLAFMLLTAEPLRRSGGGGRRDHRHGVLGNPAVHRDLVRDPRAAARQSHLRRLRRRHHPAGLALPGLGTDAVGGRDQCGAALPAMAPFGDPASADPGRPAGARPADADGNAPARAENHRVLYRCGRRGSPERSSIAGEPGRPGQRDH